MLHGHQLTHKSNDTPEELPDFQALLGTAASPGPSGGHAHQLQEELVTQHRRIDAARDAGLDHWHARLVGSERAQQRDMEESSV